MRRTPLFTLFALALLFSACAKKKHAPPPVAALPSPGWTQSGIASWYGNPYHGRATSSGEIYDMNDLTAAHRTLPFGALVRVTNLSNNRRVEVRVNDRGPFIDGRVIDLSREAARRIELIRPGTARVRIDLLSYKESLTSSSPAYYAVQLGTPLSRADVDRLRQRLAKSYSPVEAFPRPGANDEWIVRLAHVFSETEADNIAAALRSDWGPAFPIRIEPRTPSTNRRD